MTPKTMWKRSGAVAVVMALAFVLVLAMTSAAFAVSDEFGGGSFAAPYAPYTAGPVVHAEPYAPYTAGPVVREIRTLPYAGYTDLAPRPGVNPRIGNFLEY